MREPRLGGGDEARRTFGAALSRQLADKMRRTHALLFPGKTQTAGGEIELADHVEERRKQRHRRDLARLDELRDREHVDRPDRVALPDLGARHRAVRRPEIDAHAEAGAIRRFGVGPGHYATSTSA